MNVRHLSPGRLLTNEYAVSIPIRIHLLFRRPRGETGKYRLVLYWLFAYASLLGPPRCLHPDMPSCLAV